MGTQPQVSSINQPNTLKLNGPSLTNYAWSQPVSSLNPQPVIKRPNEPKQYAVNNTVSDEDKKANKISAFNMINKSAKDLQNTLDTGSAKDVKAGIENFNSTYGTNLKDPRFIKFGAKGRAIAGAIGDASQALQAGITVADNFTSYLDNKKKQREFNSYLRDQQLSDNLYKPQQGSRGEWVQTGSGYGTFRPDQMVTDKGMYTAAFGGSLNNNNMKIRITGGPHKMEYGGQKGFGFDDGAKNIYTTMNSNSYDSVSNTMPEVSRAQANIEAEKGETIVGDIDGDGRMEHMNIEGKRHSEKDANGNGGTPLNAPEGSFIFSKKLKEKNPEVLKAFNKTFKKGGISYSDIAKQYDLNKYKAILEDPYADDTSKKTAQMMYDNYQKKLGMLSMVQEGSKGFPDKQVPLIAQMAMGQTEAAYGGYVPRMQVGGGTPVKTIKTYQPGFQTDVLDPKIKDKYNIYKPGTFEDEMPELQTTLKPGVYGTNDWTDKEHMDDFKKRFPDFIKANPNWNPSKPGETEKFQKWYNQNVDPTYFSGKKNKTGYALDDKFGQHTWSAPGWNKEPERIPGKIPIPGKTPPKYICINGAIQESTVGYDTVEEAKINCEQNTVKDVPFDYLTPDKLNLLATAAQPVNKYFPYIPEKNYKKPNPVFESPERALAANAEEANIMNQGLMNFAGNPGNYMSNASGIQGKAAGLAANIMAEVNNRNINRANEFELQRTAIANKEMEENALRQEKLSAYNATLGQNYDNAIGKKVIDVAKSYSQAWKNRMKLHDTNMNNQFFYKDPTSGRTIFKGSPGGFADVGDYSGAGVSNPYFANSVGTGNLGSSFASTYKTYLNELKDVDMSDEKKKERAAELATLYLRGSKTTNSYNPFNPNRSRYTTSGYNFPSAPSYYDEDGLPY
jgi:hypothetical protein